jgi:hypothetical protein
MRLRCLIRPETQTASVLMADAVCFFIVIDETLILLFSLPDAHCKCGKRSARSRGRRERSKASSLSLCPFEREADTNATRTPCDNKWRQESTWRHDGQQRPQAELKPAAFALLRVGFGRLGLHRRIIPDRGRAEQEILRAALGRVHLSAAGREGLKFRRQLSLVPRLILKPIQLRR